MSESLIPQEPWIDLSKSLLPEAYYQSEDVVGISKDLLGKVLVSEIDGLYTAGIIVETEAYRAPEDKASHAYGLRRTSRTETMYHQGGVSYVYICYGIHHLFNVVTGPQDLPHAVLVRAVEPIAGIEHMLERRKMLKPQTTLSAGPGVMSAALGIRTLHNALPLSASEGLIRIEDWGIEIEEKQILASPRVGVAYARECAAWPWRFRVLHNLWTSPAK